MNTLPMQSPLLDMPLPRRTGELLARHSLRPVKSLGQNFLIDQNIARKMVAAALEASPTTVLEIGAGLGALTVPLARSGLRVVAYEKDKKLQAPLQELLSGFPSVHLCAEDFLKADLEPHLGPDTVVLGNLPFYITTPILEKLFACQPTLKTIIVTVQQEVADRLAASPATSEYGSLTIFCAYHVDAITQVCRLPPQVFRPAPSIQSVAVQLTPRRQPPPGITNPEAFFTGVRAAFGYRRKTLLRALATAPEAGLDRPSAQGVLAAAVIDPIRRGETLSFEEFVALGEALAAWRATS